MIDTREISGGSYPEPPEIEEKTINIEIVIKGSINVPKEWNRDKIEWYIDDLDCNELINIIDDKSIENVDL